MSNFNNLLKPRIVNIENVSLNNTRVTLEPLERGFGHTLGSALRRIMLSSIVGSSITEVSIEGVQHEYSNIEGIQEDVIDIMLNLKEISFKMNGNNAATLSLTKNEVGPVTASDIELKSDIEIVNPDHVIANITTKGASINMQIEVSEGIGYSSANQRKDNANRIVGSLLIDASYSPIKKVSYKVDSARVEQRTDLDKLIIVGLGDLVESCSGHYAMQTFTTVLDERQQKTLARQMLLDVFNKFSKDFNEVLGLCALGNHGEKRIGTKAYTTFGDNKDGELFDEVAQVLKADPSKKHVKFTIPDQSLAYSVEVLPGTVLTIAHGHQAKRGTTPAQRVENWFNKMASKPSKGGFYATNILLVGHYHHFWTKESERLMLGATTLDSGSQWFEENGGEKSIPGITTLVVHSNKDLRKWSDIEIL